jgi:hypothetical protein
MTLLEGVVTKAGVMGKTVTVTVSYDNTDTEYSVTNWSRVSGIEKGHPPHITEGDEKA